MRGRGFWINASMTNHWTANSIRVYISGSVPLGSATTSTIAGIQGQDLLAYPFPLHMLATNIAILQQVAVGSSFITWDVPSQQYATWSRSRSGWTPSMSTVNVSATQGFWIASTTNITWTETYSPAWN